MQATADSKMVKINGAIKYIVDTKGVRDTKALPRRVISKCPAIKLAVRRTHRVIGRMIFLVNSIATIKFINMGGVPCGNRWANMCFVFLTQPNIITVVQKINDIGKVIVRWEVGEKIWGYRAKKFMIRMETKAIMIINSVPFSVFPRENLTSFFKVATIFLKILFKGFFVFHIVTEIMEVDANITSHDILKIEELGSNTENKFLIIWL